LIVTIHQPEYLPWLGFVHKAAMADVIILLDNVQFRKNYFQNRNKIRTSTGYAWITVPIKKHPLNTPICEIEVNNSILWQKKCLKTFFYTYKKSPFFHKYMRELENIYSQKWLLLADLNTHIIKKLFLFFGLETDIVVSTDLGKISGKRDTLLLDLCLKVGATTYISGISGKEYLISAKFERQGIKVVYQEFYHPIYNQLYEPFLHCMSSIDLLFNYGDNSRNILLNDNTPRLDYLIE